MKRLATAFAASLVVGAACGDDSSSSGSDEAVNGTVTVLAASSLTEAFEELGAEFEEYRPEIAVEFSFAASSELAAQIQQGAPADVFASADEESLQKVIDSGEVTAEPAVFARNRLAIAVEKGNPENIAGLDDLDQSGLVVILCAEQVPCGRFADEALANAGVSVTPASRAENVKAALTPVELGEADAAVVYVTDVQASGQVDGVAIPKDVNVVASYPFAPLAEAGNRDAATAFIRYVRSGRGQQVLREFGFLEP
ncbi:MAG: molybdate ABC transporter substrate-binding protein [Acidimicrobiia bacterium]